MIRNILAVLAGYFVIMLAVFALLTGAYLVFGTERAFEPGSYKTSLSWCITSLILGLPAAFLGGWICSRIACSPKAVVALAVILFVLGILVAVPTFSPPQDLPPRPSNVPNMEAMMKAQTPAWVALLNPVIGVIGVMLGGRKRSLVEARPPREPVITA